MINIRSVKKFCNGDITQIENYEKAINDITQTWDCHHRRETDENLSKTELINQCLYFDRPASELIFLTSEEHIRLHQKGKNNNMYGKHHSIETRKKQSEAHKGEKNPMYGKPSHNRGKHLSEETKQKLRVANIGKHYSIETRNKHSEAFKGENNPMYGKPSPNRGKHRVYDNKELKIYHYE